MDSGGLSLVSPARTLGIGRRVAVDRGGLFGVGIGHKGSCLKFLSRTRLRMDWISS